MTTLQKSQLISAGAGAGAAQSRFLHLPACRDGPGSGISQDFYWHHSQERKSHPPTNRMRWGFESSSQTSSRHSQGAMAPLMADQRVNAEGKPLCPPQTHPAPLRAWPNTAPGLDLTPHKAIIKPGHKAVGEQQQQ